MLFSYLPTPSLSSLLLWLLMQRWQPAQPWYESSPPSCPREIPQEHPGGCVISSFSYSPLQLALKQRKVRMACQDNIIVDCLQKALLENLIVDLRTPLPPNIMSETTWRKLQGQHIAHNSILLHIILFYILNVRTPLSPNNMTETILRSKLCWLGEPMF